MNVVSLSTGKDSEAVLCYAMVTEPHESIRAAFADTGNEHELVHEHLDYLERETGIVVVRLRADFTDWWWHRRDYIRDHWHLPHRDWPDGVPAEAITRSLAVFEKGPTGNPYLDLCIIKGRFPSRRAQFCTQFLKTEPLTEYQDGLVDAGAEAVWSWQGVRAEEGGRRRFAKEFEQIGPTFFIYRPIIRWKAADCFEAMAALGLKPNPLYKLGMDRVGCMPCINSGKDDLREVARRFPHHVDRIEEWEAAVSAASKRGRSSFFPAPDDGRGEQQGRNIRERIQWSKTKRGGDRKQELIFEESEPAACSSSYGLCE